MNASDTTTYECIYEKFFSLFESELQKVKQMQLICDDEQSNHNAFENVFKNKFDINVNVNLCCWHFCRNLITNLSTRGHANLIKKGMQDYDPNFESQFTMLKYLHLLPEEGIIPAINYIRTKSVDLNVSEFGFKIRRSKCIRIWV